MKFYVCKSSNVQNKPMNPSTLNELKSILFNDFDIVGTVERFNDSMQLLAQMAGIPSIRMGYEENRPSELAASVLSSFFLCIMIFFPTEK